jgi:hypothetical protein
MHPMRVLGPDPRTPTPPDKPVEAALLRLTPAWVTEFAVEF